MTEPEYKSVSILCAAAAHGDQFWSLPQTPVSTSDWQSPDPLGALMLRLTESVLGGIQTATLPQSFADIALILGTTRGCPQSDWEFDRSRREAGGRYASPAAFARTLPSTIPAELSVKLRLTGPMLTLCAGSASTAVALRRAISWMKHMRLRACIAGGFDASSPEDLRGAIVLLAPVDEAAIGYLHATASPPVDLACDRDLSLDQLINWIRQPRPLQLSGGIHLEPAER